MIENVIGNALDELYHAFDVMNRDKFDNSLPPVVITIQDEKGSYGHFTTKKVWLWEGANLDELDVGDNNINKEDGYYEININPRYFNEQSPVDIICTLLHEMCHYWNKINNIKDCAGKRHNKKFKKSAERVGFVVSELIGYGFGKTDPTDELIDYIENEVNPQNEVFEHFRCISLNKKDKEKKKRKKTSFNYTCPNCGQTLKGKKNLYILCGICKQDFEMEDDEEENESETEDNLSFDN